MLRWLVGALVVANLAFWAWTQPGLVQALGLPTASDREPQRLALQQQAQAIRVLPAPGSAASANGSPNASPISSPTAGPAGPAGPAGSAATGSTGDGPGLQACLETPALKPDQVPLAVRALQQAGVAPGGWVEMRRDVPGEWLLYMGRFADREQLQRKASELSAMQLRFEEILSGELAPGLQLGRFDAAAPAQARLAQLQGRGVRTARVLTTQAPSQELRLRADRLTPALMANLQVAAASAAPASEIRWLACGP